MIDARPEKPGLTQTGRLLRSILLAIATVGLITLAPSKLPYSPMRDQIVNYASRPGQAIADFFYPGDERSGMALQYWTLIFAVSSGLFYSAVWYCVLWLFGANLMTRQAKRR